MTALTLRPYQAEDLQAVEDAWREGTRAPAVVWATGLGKTMLFSFGAAHWLEYLAAELRTGRRIVVLAHRTELVEQAYAKLRAVLPPIVTIGIVKAERNQTLADVVVSSPQTLKTLGRRRQLLDVGLVVADECHHYAAPSFREVLDHFTGQGAFLLGVTATMSRSDSRSLGAVWERVVAQRDISFGIAQGFLVRPRGERVRVDDLDMRAVRRRGGDYDPDSLGDALSASMAPKRIVESVAEHAPREKVVVFAPNIASADVIADEFRAADFKTESVNYRTPAGRRRDILAEHADESPGSTQVVCNSMVLTEGWDNPLCSTAVLARKTTNNGLYVQMVGRILRPFPGKTGALVLDVAGATEVNSLQAQIDLFGPDLLPDEERDPCVCPRALLSLAVPALCVCRRDGCREDCSCGGGKACGCTWPEQVELEVDRDEVYADGRLVTETVDLFHGSALQWLSTAGGTHFLAVGGRYIAIIPGQVRRTWDVVAMDRYKVGGPATRYVQRGIADLGFAQAWAEADVRPSEQGTAVRERGWRARQPSEAQWAKAAGLGIPRLPDLHSGELSNLITCAEATVRIDHRVAYIRAAQREA